MRQRRRRISRRMPGRRLGSADSQGRERLLDAAIALFAERGIANTTVARIAAAGGVTSAMVHYWFDNRERLLEALVRERLAPLFGYVWSQPSSPTLTPIALAEGVMQRMLEVTAKNSWLPSLWLREVVNEGGLLRELAMRRIPLERVAAFTRAMARGRESGELNPGIEPALIFISILGLVMLPQAVAKIWQRLNPDLTLAPAMLARHVAALLMHGIASRAAASARRGRKRPGGHS
jgi:AcrR family transcriptional regulator